MSDDPLHLNLNADVLWPETDNLWSEDALHSLAERAKAADAGGSLEQRAIQQLREAGYFGLPVPLELGGSGAGLLHCAAIQRLLGAADPALAIAVNMHLFSVGMSVAHWRRERDSCGLLLGAIATQQRVMASAFAEEGLGGSLLRSTVTARPVEGGYVVSGRKSPCSLALHCDLVFLQMLEQTPQGDSLLMAVVNASSDGIEAKESWDSLGMRASGSDTLVFEDCFVPKELVFHRCEPGGTYDETLASGLVWFCITTTATYLGVVKSALAEARSGLRRTPVAYLDLPRGELASIQGALGELIAEVLTIESALIAVADRFDRGGLSSSSILPLAVAIRHASIAKCIRAVEDSGELLGGSSYARESTLARLWRDVQAVRFHPPTRLVSRQLLGRWALDLPFTLEMDDGKA